MTSDKVEGVAAWRWLVFASRRGDEVVVYRRPLGRGDVETLFAYREPGGTGGPDVAVSPDGRLVGYTVANLEVHVRDLDSGQDDVLATGRRKDPPPGSNVVAPEWSVDEMNLEPTETADCPECGILGVGGIRFSPSGTEVGFGQRFYEGANWAVVDRATRRYVTTGDGGGVLHWKSDEEVMTIGAFYAESAAVREGPIAQLPRSRVVVGNRRLLDGSLNSGADRVVLISDDPSRPSARLRVSVVPLPNGRVVRIDASDREKLTAGFTGDGTPVWVERRGLSAVLAHQNATATPLPEDLYAFGPITPTGPTQIGLVGERRPVCSQITAPCQDPTPPFERRYVLVNLDGSVAWQSPGANGSTSFAGISR